MRSANTYERRKHMTPYSQAPHVEPTPKAPTGAPNAALLIDFDNVTMGMRSDLSKELKSLLQSDVIRGKVTVQRAYADWRRYPQYIVPLSEASVDLIFAPAYGSSKKNATDIRMAIDGVELVFIRPEIGTFILLTGDSDFSSLVLKLKEYGKYVIGVGIQESSSDILVQNCDEYYSYTSLTGLRKTTGTDDRPVDPWELVEKAIQRMTKRGDVMRSDRLKQVMIELDNNFNEGNFGFSKFSKFLAEASSRGRIRIHRLENGQYEVSPGGRRSSGKTDTAGESAKDRRPSTPRRGRTTRGGSGRSTEARGADKAETVRSEPSPGGEPTASAREVDPAPLRAAYDLMLDSLREFKEKGKDSVRDSDVKRKMLARRTGFDEAELGFSKFSRFLLQAQEQGVVQLEKTETGNYRVSLKDGDEDRPLQTQEGLAPSPEEKRAEGPGEDRDASRGMGPRGGSGGRRGKDQQPVLFEGQAVGGSIGATTPSQGSGATGVGDLGLPTSVKAMSSYLTNSYSGVGKKTADALVEAFGKELFSVLQNSPERVREVVPRRGDQVLEEWRADFSRRVEGGVQRSGGPAGGAQPEVTADAGPEEAQSGVEPTSERSQAGNEPRSEEPRSEAAPTFERSQPRAEPTSETLQAQEEPTPPAGRAPQARGGQRRTRRGGRHSSPSSEEGA